MTQPTKRFNTNNVGCGPACPPGIQNQQTQNQSHKCFGPNKTVFIRLIQLPYNCEPRADTRVRNLQIHKTSNHTNILIRTMPFVRFNSDVVRLWKTDRHEALSLRLTHDKISLLNLYFHSSLASPASAFTFHFSLFTVIASLLSVICSSLIHLTSISII